MKFSTTYNESLCVSPTILAKSYCMIYDHFVKNVISSFLLPAKQAWNSCFYLLNYRMSGGGTWWTFITCNIFSVQLTHILKTQLWMVSFWLSMLIQKNCRLVLISACNSRLLWTEHILSRKSMLLLVCYLVYRHCFCLNVRMHIFFQERVLLLINII